MADLNFDTARVTALLACEARAFSQVRQAESGLGKGCALPSRVILRTGHQGGSPVQQ